MLKTTQGRIAWLAVVAGFWLDLFITMLVRGVMGMIEPELSTVIVLTTIPGIISAVLLVLSTGVGGWLAGRLAGTEYVLHGVLVGGIGIIYMLLMSIFGSEPIPLVNIVLQCIAVLVGALGGWLSQWLPTRQHH